MRLYPASHVVSKWLTDSEAFITTTHSRLLLQFDEPSPNRLSFTLVAAKLASNSNSSNTYIILILMILLYTVHCTYLYIITYIHIINVLRLFFGFWTSLG